MATVDPLKIPIYHITPISNLPQIVAHGCLLSDARLELVAHEVIGYGTIKHRRLTQYRIPCHGYRFVGEFVPFYYCYRSPMLYTINRGNTGKQAGCQKDIVHLVSTVGKAISLERAWAISDGNAGAGHTLFSNDLDTIHTLDWAAINATSWGGRQHEKAAELLVADEFPWAAVDQIACYSDAAAADVRAILAGAVHRPPVVRQRGWYY